MAQTFDLASRINPAYSARRSTDDRSGLMVKLPIAPLNASPVPGLTSLYHDDNAGDDGDRSYPGNCGGNLIRDILRFYQPTRVFDPMSGSGTCRDVCDELGIECVSADIHDEFDLCDPAMFLGPDRFVEPGDFDFVWLHPPYWRMKLYAKDPRDLSRAPPLKTFLYRYRLAIQHCEMALRPGGKLAILMGDYVDREIGFVPLTYHTKQLALRRASGNVQRTSFASATARRAAVKSIAVRLYQACMTCFASLRRVSRKAHSMHFLLAKCGQKGLCLL